MVWECWAPMFIPAPMAVRITMRTVHLAAEHVAELGGLVVDLVHADADEISKHQFRHRP